MDKPKFGDLIIAEEGKLWNGPAVGWYEEKSSEEDHPYITYGVSIDKVNKPAHYQGKGMEVYDVIKAFDLSYDEGNVVKYLLRYRKKNGLEDLQKAQWYLGKIIQGQKANSWGQQEIEGL